MNTFYRLFSWYVINFAIIWGFITFTYNYSKNKCEVSKKLMIWNRVMTFITTAVLFTHSILLYHILQESGQLSFTIHFRNFVTIVRLVYFCFTLLVTCRINQSITTLVNSVIKLQNCIKLPEKAYKEISWSYSPIFCIDGLALLFIVYFTMVTIGMMNWSRIVVSYPGFWLTIGFKHIISSYIFAVLLASQLIKQTNAEIVNILYNKDISSEKMATKNCAVSLENQAILYEEVMNFVKRLHSTTSFNTTLTILTNMQEIVKSVRPSYFVYLTILTFFLDFSIS